jgi:hypothetical protein
MRLCAEMSRPSSLDPNDGITRITDGEFCLKAAHPRERMPACFISPVQICTFRSGTHGIALGDLKAALPSRVQMRAKSPPNAVLARPVGVHHRAASSSLSASSAALSRSVGVRMAGSWVDSIVWACVCCCENRESAWTDVTHLPPSRTPSSFKRVPSGNLTPSEIHRQIVAGETGRSPRKGGSRCAACDKLITVSESKSMAWEGFVVIRLSSCSFNRLR